MYYNDRDYYELEEEELDRYLTPAQVMELLCIGKNTIYQLLNSGQLKGFRVGKQWRIAREELKRLAAH